MAAIDIISKTARTYLRDFPKFFQVSFDALGRTYELGQPNVDIDSFWVATVTSGVVTPLTTSQYSLDNRNAILRLATTPSGSTKLLIEGYYYEWVLPADLDFYSQKAINSHMYNLGISIENASPEFLDTVGLAALLEVLWALMTEYARDIDVMTSESIHIPGSQRFRMLQGLIQQWEETYRKHAKALNIGLERIEIMNLRRVSRTTNRLVPLYKAKELGDYGPLERVFTERDPEKIIHEEEEPLREDVYIDTLPQTNVTSNAFF